MSEEKNKEKTSNRKETVAVLGVNIHPLTKKELLKKIVFFLNDQEQHYIVTTNAEFLVTAQKDEKFKRILNSADLSLADGTGPVWSSYFLDLPVNIPKVFSPEKQKAYRKRKIRNQLLFSLILNLIFPQKVKKIVPERISGADIILDICQIIAENDLSLYLLGGDKESSVATKFKLEKMFPDLIISGMKSGFNKEEIANEVLVEAVRKAQPDVLFVALGHPYQEKWIYQNLDKLPSVKLAIGVGGSLDFLSGKRKRAPKFLQKVNLEWLWRFLQEPSRFQRIKRAVWEFPLAVYREKILLAEKLEEEKKRKMMEAMNEEE